MEKALRYLAGQQLPDGSFAGSSSARQTPWEPRYDCATIFVPALILNCLVDVDAAAITKPLSQFLLGQKSTDWSFNYWARDSKEFTEFPYPDDLDDTFCALIALYRYDPKLVQADGLARVVRILLAAETRVGGPYKTWLANMGSGPAWQDVDVAVNANIAYFLSLIDSPSPPLLQYLEQSILFGNFTSRYYPSSFPLWYYLARVCPESCQKQLRETIYTGANASLGPLDLALAVTSLCQLNASAKAIRPLITQLRQQQAPDGSWPAAGFCLDPMRDGDTYYQGSATLTTAFAIEAISEYKKLLAPKRIAKHPTLVDSVQAAITIQIEKDLANLMPDLQQQAKRFLRKLIASDKSQEITLLPYYFAKSLKEAPSFEQDFYVQLGLANLYGWVAYTIYDDFLDEEGQPALLSVANLALRSSVDYFRTVLPDCDDFQALVQQTFNTIDGANAWELANCRSKDVLPSYGKRDKLAERSLGHTLTPIAVLARTGLSVSDPSVTALQDALRHYLIARQLDDDAHDWEEDLARGHITYVVAELLQGLRASGQPDMHVEFWHNTLPAITKLMDQHIAKARASLAKIDTLRPENVVSGLLQKITDSTKLTRSKRAESIQFLQTYREIIK